MKNYLIVLIAFTALSISCKKHTAIYDFTTTCKRTVYSGHQKPPPAPLSELALDSLVTPMFTVEHHTEKSFDEIEASDYVTAHTKVVLNGENCLGLKKYPSELWNKIGTDSFTCTYVVHY